MGSAKVLEITVEPKRHEARLGFANRVVELFRSESQLDAVAKGDAVVVLGVWYPDFDRAAELIAATSEEELLWGEPQIVYRYEEVELRGKRKQIVLEPILLVEVTTPPDYIGNVIGDMMSRRGLMLGHRENDDKSITVSAEVPLAELRGYDKTLLEITGERGVVSVAVLKYLQGPPYIGPPDEPVSMALRA